MTTQELLALFNNAILKNRWWNRFANSQFLKMMAVFSAQVIYYARMYAENALPEGFISTANKRSSILAAAEDRGYVARLVIPSAGLVTINNRTQRVIQLPLYTTLWGENQYPYVLMDVVDLQPQQVIQNVHVKQMEKVIVTQTVTTSEEFYAVLLPKDVTAKAVSLEVFIVIGGKKEKWEENPQFRLANDRSKNYVIFYKPTEQLGIRFGDGSIGMKVPDNCEIQIEVWTSEGDITLVSNQRLTPSGTYQNLATEIEVITSTPITDGSAMESTEETRNRAMYSVAYDDQIVWRGDYKFFLKGKIAGITWLNVWGETEEEDANGAAAIAAGHKDGDVVTDPKSGRSGVLKLNTGTNKGKLYSIKNTNTIFISAHKPGLTQAQLEAQILKELGAIPNSLNKQFYYYPTNDLPFHVEVTGTAYTEVVIPDATVQIRRELERLFGKDAETFETTKIGDYEKVRVNNIWAAIQALNLMSEFQVKIVGMAAVTRLNDYVYLDSQASLFDIKYKGER